MFIFKKFGFSMTLALFFVFVFCDLGEVEAGENKLTYVETVSFDYVEGSALQIKVDGGVIDSIEGFNKDSGEVDRKLSFHYVTDSNRIADIDLFHLTSLEKGKLQVTIKANDDNYSIKVNNGLTKESAIDYTDLDVSHGNYIKNALSRPKFSEQFVKLKLDAHKEYFFKIGVNGNFYMYAPSGKKVLNYENRSIQDGIFLKPPETGDYVIHTTTNGMLFDFSKLMRLDLMEVMENDEYELKFSGSQYDRRTPVRKVAIKVNGLESYYIDNNTSEGNVFGYGVDYFTTEKGSDYTQISPSSLFSFAEQNKTALAFNKHENTFVNILGAYSSSDATKHNVDLKIGRFTPRTGDSVKSQVEELNAGIRDDSLVADPVDSFAGNFKDSRKLLNYSGNNPLYFELNYDSIATDSKSLSLGFTHNFETYIEDEDDELNLYWNPSSVVKFSKEGSSYKSVNPSQKNITLVKKKVGYEVVDEQNQIYIFDDEGKLLSKKDTIGLVTHYSYESNRLMNVENDKGQAFYFEYNAENKLVKVLDEEGRDISFIYNNSGNLSEIKDIEDYSLKFSYSTAGVFRIPKVSSITHDGVQLIRNKYDEIGRISEQYNKGTGYVYFKYDDYRDESKVVTEIESDTRKEVYVHDKKGNLLSVTDGEGYTNSYTYDKNNNRISHKDKNDNTFRYEYDSNNRLITEINPDETYKEYKYDDNNNLIQIITEDRLSIKNTFDNNRLVSVRDKAGNIKQYEYDDFGNVTKIIDGSKMIVNKYNDKGYLIEVDKNGKVNRFKNDPLGRVLELTLPNGDTVNYTYNSTGNVTKIEHADGSEELYEYNAFGDKIRSTDSNGNVATYEYDLLGNLTKEILGDREVISTYNKFGDITRKEIKLNKSSSYYERFSYDSRGYLTEYDNGINNYSLTYDGNGNVLLKTTDSIAENYSYDNMNNLISYIDGNGNETKYTLDSIGNVIKEDRPNGVVLNYTYDSLDNLILESDGNGNKTEYEYDENNNLVYSKEPNGAVKEYEYNSSDQITKTINALGEVISYNYNDLGQRIEVINPLDEVLYKYEYDSLGNITKITDGNGHSSELRYDSKGNLLEIKDAKGNTVELNEYNMYDQLITQTDALDNQLNITYDGVGNVIETKDAKENETKYEYTRNNILNRVVDSGDTRLEYGYNGFGNLEYIKHRSWKTDIFVRDGNQNIIKESPYSLGDINYTYDGNDSLVNHTNARGQAILYDYDKNGNVIKEISDNGVINHAYDKVNNLLSSASENSTIEREYDLLGRVISKTEDGKTITYEYDKRGHLVKLGYPNGKILDYKYDVMGNLLEVKDWNGKVTSYEYDVNNQLVKTVNWNNTIEERMYDKKGQLSKIKTTLNDEVVDVFTYEYDENGNIVKENDLVYEYDNLNRLVKAGSNKYTYDDFGNIKNYSVDDSTSINMDYGRNHQLESVNRSRTQIDKDGNLTKYKLNDKEFVSDYDVKNRLTRFEETNYEYNVENERIGLTIDSRSTSFVIDNESGKYSRVLEETIDEDTKYYIYGNGLIGEYNEDEFITYHYDLRGSTTSLTSEVGIVIGEVTYDEYGVITKKDDEVDIRFLYNGKYGVQTDENGLYYMRARYYNPDLKRFMNRDVLIGNLYDIQSLNRYAFVNGDPISYHDPFGLARESANGTTLADNIHLALDLAGFIPVLGEVFDVVNGIYYLSEGNYQYAMLSGMSAIPVVGNVTTAGKYGIKAYKNYKPIYYKGKTKVNGEVRDISRKVFQRTDLDYNKIDPRTGLTNRELMKKGRSPIAEDGSKIDLHHLTQKEAGTMVELPRSTHKKYHRELHGLTESGRSFRNNKDLEKQYNNFRNSYWKWRGGNE